MLTTLAVIIHLLTFVASCLCIVRDVVYFVHYHGYESPGTS